MTAIEFSWIHILVWFVFNIIIHELGHYIAFRYYGIKPKIKIKWWGVLIGQQKDLFKITPYKYSIIALSGIFPGLLFTTMVMDNFWILVYILMCLVDIQIIIASHGLKYDKKESLGHLQLREILEIKKEADKDLIQ